MNTQQVQTPEQARDRINNQLTELIGNVDGTTTAVDRVVKALAKMKNLDRTYAVRNLVTRAMSCQHYHSPVRGLE